MYEYHCKWCSDLRGFGLKEFGLARVYCTVLLFCVAIAARVPFEGVEREDPSEESYLLTYLATYLLNGQSEQNMYFYMRLYCAFYKFLEVQIMHIGVKRGVNFSCTISFCLNFFWVKIW